MGILLQLEQPGYGIFSAYGLSSILSCWILLAALRPWCLAVSRISDWLSACRGLLSKSYATSLHGLDSSSAGAISYSYLMRGEALVTGLLIFVIGLSAEIFGTTSRLTESIFTIQNHGSILGVAGMAGFFLSGILDNTNASWRQISWSRLSGLGNMLTYGAAIPLFFMSNYDFIAVLSYVALGAGTRAGGVILSRGLQVYGVGALIWVPLQYTTWLTTTLIIAFLGPLFFILSRLSEGTGFASLPLGSKRELQISTAEIALPRSHALDTFGGMISPR